MERGHISGEDMVRLNHLQSCLMEVVPPHLLAQRERFLLCWPHLVCALVCGLDLWNTRICRMCNLEIGSSLGIYISLPSRY